MQRGYRREDALAEAGPTRLRPILMTTLAQILGALPIAMALGRGAEFRQGLGIVVVGGLSLSSVLTLLVIPCTYTVVDDIGIGIGKIKDRVLGNR
ncbi:MAG: efflux RND transporter permease subunit [Armatimonas sp.]